LFAKGETKLAAIALVDEQELKDEIIVAYQTEKWETPVHFKINEVSIDDNYSWVEVQAYDKNNIRCLDAGNRVRFTIAGDAKLIKNRGTVSGSSVVELCNGAAKIKIEKLGSVYSVAVQSEGLKTAILQQDN
jgi:beta-galactosidase